LRKRTVECAASSEVGTIGEPKLREVGPDPLPTVECDEIIDGGRDRRERSVTGRAQFTFHPCPVSLGVAYVFDLRDRLSSASMAVTSLTFDRVLSRVLIAHPASRFANCSGS